MTARELLDFLASLPDKTLPIAIHYLPPSGTSDEIIDFARSVAPVDLFDSRDRTASHILISSSKNNKS